MTDDSGFAPHVDKHARYLTLATCKPKIRKSAQKGDWIAGFGGKTLYRRCKNTYEDLGPRLIYAAQITHEPIDYDSYHGDRRFRGRKDNIYYRNSKGCWRQDVNLFHDKSHIKHDTSVSRVLISIRFLYFGSNAPRMEEIAPEYSMLLKKGPGHRKFYLDKTVSASNFIDELERKYRKHMNKYSEPTCPHDIAKIHDRCR